MAPRISHVVEYRVLYTSNITQKLKKWHDGTLKYYQLNRKVEVFSEQLVLVCSKFLDKPGESVLFDGNEFKIEAFLINVEEKTGGFERDVSHLYKKRDSKREQLSAHLRTPVTQESRSLKDVIAETKAKNASKQHGKLAPMNRISETINTVVEKQNRSKTVPCRQITPQNRDTANSRPRPIVYQRCSKSPDVCLRSSDVCLKSLNVSSKSSKSSDVSSMQMAKKHSVSKIGHMKRTLAINAEYQPRDAPLDSTANRSKTTSTILRFKTFSDTLMSQSQRSGRDNSASAAFVKRIPKFSTDIFNVLNEQLSGCSGSDNTQYGTTTSSARDKKVSVRPMKLHLFFEQGEEEHGDDKEEHDKDEEEYDNDEEEHDDDADDGNDDEEIVSNESSQNSHNSLHDSYSLEMEDELEGNYKDNLESPVKQISDMKIKSEFKIEPIGHKRRKRNSKFSNSRIDIVHNLSDLEEEDRFIEEIENYHESIGAIESDVENALTDELFDDSLMDSIPPIVLPNTVDSTKLTDEIIESMSPEASPIKSKVIDMNLLGTPSRPRFKTTPLKDLTNFQRTNQTPVTKGFAYPTPSTMSRNKPFLMPTFASKKPKNIAPLSDESEFELSDVEDGTTAGAYTQTITYNYGLARTTGLDASRDLLKKKSQ